MLFYYQKNGREFGPLIANEFYAKLKSGEIGDDTPVRTDLLPQWSTLEELLHSGILEEAGPRREAEQLAAQKKRDEQLHAVAFSNRALVSLPKDFGDPVERARAYGDYLQRMFPMKGPPGPCTLYRNALGETRAVFYFEGSFNAGKKVSSSAGKFLLVILLGPLGHLLSGAETAKKEKVGFFTAHDFSRPAASEMRRRWSRSIACWWLGVLTMAGLLLAVVFALGLALVAPDSSNTEAESQKMTQWALEGMLAAGGLLLATWGLFRWAKALRLPPKLRTFEKSPFRLRKITWIGFDER